MFMHNFTESRMDILKRGTSPRLKRISHTFNNPSWKFAFHNHPDGVELMYIAGGKAIVSLNQKNIHVERGDVLLIDKGVIHALSSDPEDPSDIWCCLVGDIEFSDSDSHYSFMNAAKSGVFRSYISNTMEQLYSLSYLQPPVAQEICHQLAASLVLLFHQLLLDTRMEEDVCRASFAQDVMIYLNEHYEEKITLSSLADQFFTCESRISREFKREYGISPINYLIDKRLGEAQWLLINTNESITSISERVGYLNYYYFNKLFTDRTGMTPSQFKEKYASISPEVM